MIHIRNGLRIVIDVIYAICIVPNKLLSVIGLNNVSSWKIFWKEQKKIVKNNCRYFIICRREDSTLQLYILKKKDKRIAKLEEENRRLKVELEYVRGLLYAKE